mmetsp:Transcript_8408/g.19035  ORF Transcript_8408/g.19035 Transcript_8408/m.19035 type:complete len:93 (+) Transcript_8408:61-339(+)
MRGGTRRACLKGVPRSTCPASQRRTFRLVPAAHFDTPEPLAVSRLCEAGGDNHGDGSGDVEVLLLEEDSPELEFPNSSLVHATLSPLDLRSL